MAVGVDGCSGGWIAAHFDGSGVRWSLHNEIADLARRYPKETLAIDMPMGLTDGSIFRTLESKARPLLKPARTGSLFVPPCRAAVYATSYEEAKNINHEITGKKFSIQAWHLVPKIKEIDHWLQTHPEDTDRFIECHPEICFAQLNNGRPASHYKKSKDGYLERLKILSLQGMTGEPFIEDALRTFSNKDVSRDDLIDALVLASTCWLAESRSWQFISQQSNKDTKGIRLRLGFVSNGIFGNGNA